MNLEQLIDRLKRTPSFMENVTHWETLPAVSYTHLTLPTRDQV